MIGLTVSNSFQRQYLYLYTQVEIANVIFGYQKITK